jgi:CRISPR-associated protein Csb2
VSAPTALVPLLRDIAAECTRRGLPKPEVELLDLSVGPRDGVVARLRLRFAVAVAGPILLGRDSHKGGGLFEATMP